MFVKVCLVLNAYCAKMIVCKLNKSCHCSPSLSKAKNSQYALKFMHVGNFENFCLGTLNWTLAWTDVILTREINAIVETEAAALIPIEFFHMEYCSPCRSIGAAANYTDIRWQLKTVALPLDSPNFVHIFNEQVQKGCHFRMPRPKIEATKQHVAPAHCQWEIVYNTERAMILFYQLLGVCKYSNFQAFF